MPRKLTLEIILAQLTDKGEYKYPYLHKFAAEAVFTFNRNTCYVGNLTLKKIKGGGDFGGNYKCEEMGNEYRVSF